MPLMSQQQYAQLQQNNPNAPSYQQAAKLATQEKVSQDLVRSGLSPDVSAQIAQRFVNAVNPDTMQVVSPGGAQKTVTVNQTPLYDASKPPAQQQAKQQQNQTSYSFGGQQWNAPSGSDAQAAWINAQRYRPQPYGTSNTGATIPISQGVKSLVERNAAKAQAEANNPKYEQRQISKEQYQENRTKNVADRYAGYGIPTAKARQYAEGTISSLGNVDESVAVSKNQLEAGAVGKAVRQEFNYPTQKKDYFEVTERATPSLDLSGTMFEAKGGDVGLGLRGNALDMNPRENQSAIKTPTTSPNIYTKSPSIDLLSNSRLKSFYEGMNRPTFVKGSPLYNLTHISEAYPKGNNTNTIRSRITEVADWWDTGVQKNILGTGRGFGYNETDTASNKLLKGIGTGILTLPSFPVRAIGQPKETIEGLRGLGVGSLDVGASLVKAQLSKTPQWNLQAKITDLSKEGGARYAQTEVSKDIFDKPIMYGGMITGMAIAGNANKIKIGEMPTETGVWKGSYAEYGGKATPLIGMKGTKPAILSYGGKVNAELFVNSEKMLEARMPTPTPYSLSPFDILTKSVRGTKTTPVIEEEAHRGLMQSYVAKDITPDLKGTFVGKDIPSQYAGTGLQYELAGREMSAIQASPAGSNPTKMNYLTGESSFIVKNMAGAGLMRQYGGETGFYKAIQERATKLLYNIAEVEKAEKMGVLRKPDIKLPEVSQWERIVIERAKKEAKEGTAVGGSYAQEYEYAGARKHGDIDLISKNPSETAKRLIEDAENAGIKRTLKLDYNPIYGKYPKHMIFDVSGAKITEIERTVNGVDLAKLKMRNIEGLNIIASEQRFADKLSMVRGAKENIKAAKKAAGDVQFLSKDKIKAAELLKSSEKPGRHQAYAYYGLEKEANYADFMSGNYRLGGSGRATLNVFPKTKIDLYPESVLKRPASLKEINAVKEELRLIDAKLAEKIKARASYAQLAKYKRLTEYANTHKGTYTSPGVEAGIRGEYEIIDTLGVKNTLTPSTLRGKIGKFFGRGDISLNIGKQRFEVQTFNRAKTEIINEKPEIKTFDWKENVLKDISNKARSEYNRLPVLNVGKTTTPFSILSSISRFSGAEKSKDTRSTIAASVKSETSGLRGNISAFSVISKTGISKITPSSKVSLSSISEMASSLRSESLSSSKATSIYEPVKFSSRISDLSESPKSRLGSYIRTSSIRNQPYEEMPPFRKSKKEGDKNKGIISKELKKKRYRVSFFDQYKKSWVPQLLKESPFQSASSAQRYGAIVSLKKKKFTGFMVSEDRSGENILRKPDKVPIWQKVAKRFYERESLGEQPNLQGGARFRELPPKGKKRLFR